MRDEEARTAWREQVAQLDPEQFVFVDECGTHTCLTRRYGWAPHDQRATGAVPRHHGHNTTLVAALTPEGLHDPWLIEGAMNTATFAWYIREEVAPRLRPGQGVVRDHVSAHTAASIREALAARGCDLLFLPPYSPDCTPIEQAFSKLKALLPRSSKPSCAAWVPAPTTPCRRPSVWLSRPLLLKTRPPGSPMRVTPSLLYLPESCSK